MRRETQHAVLFLLGAALVRIAADDTFLRYVRPAQRWWLIGAGVVMVVLAVVATIRDLRGRAVHASDGHDHRAGSSPWLLVLPVMVIALVAPPALGADAIARHTPTPIAVVADIPRLPPGPAELGVAEAVARSIDGSLGDGRDLTVTGFVAHRGGEIVVARMTIACCAADARPYTLRVNGPGVAELPVDTWVRVRGTVVAQAAKDNRWSPALEVTDLTVVPTPEDPYEY
ncbi:MAG: TIGR03943 family protein [Pseudonocardia sp.]|uniref:TIGR03943 family putative permease subunit n=1 Tax=unclassified Pseudonocardia TaxID=2619320 RepID=UPI00086B469D|nr:MULTISPECIES: TIGR03943 family protein [unclassified Pseudonocardia]MBN9112608.1 TIGR03943 family protein [Pseudonocardia sp.]ODU24876.1 MAG: TIGR03943 family protein [Pseudonocardia sp. SCN 72-51]ODV04716.1 MAG: TIGR03943 family protein [Pseudonocardia sp. SCN 73-27]